MLANMRRPSDVLSQFNPPFESFEKRVIIPTFQMRRTRPTQDINQDFFNAKAMLSLLYHDTIKFTMGVIHCFDNYLLGISYMFHRLKSHSDLGDTLEVI